MKTKEKESTITESQLIEIMSQKSLFRKILDWGIPIILIIVGFVLGHKAGLL